MANKRHLAILKKGMTAWNKWREDNPEVRPELGGADLCQANLEYANLERANLKKAKLDSAILNYANLQKANLREASLDGTHLSYANLRKANLSMAWLFGATLIHANLSGAILNRAHLNRAAIYEAKLRGANLANASLMGTLLVRSDLQKANLTNCNVFGIAAWELDLEGAMQVDLQIYESPYDGCIAVDNLEVAQFIYLIANNKKIRDVFETISRKMVLILGRFTPERKTVLDAIREELRKRDYLPVLFDFDKPATRDITETMRTLAHLSRFIIADLSDPKSIPLELQAAVPDLAVPVQPLLLSGQREFSMFVDLRKKYHWVLATHQYTDIADLLASLGDKVIAPAEQKAKELEKR